MDVTVLLFAAVAQAVGSRRISVPYEDGDTVADIRGRVVECYPQIERFLPTLMYAIDEEYAGLEDAVRPGATVALIPPVSGGC